MIYDTKYDAMPLRGKIGVNAYSLDHYGQSDWCVEQSRRCGRKLHRHYDLYKDWNPWGEGCMWAYHRRPYLGNSPNKGHRRKTWRDYR